MQILYNIAGVLLVVLAMPIFLIRAAREKGFVERMKQSFGFLSSEDLAAVANKRCIWVHAASVGEIVAASPLIKEFRLEFPDRPLLVSVVTSSGYEMAKRIVKDADSIIYFPLDLPWLSSRVVKRIRPSIFLPVETELWPNFLKAARKNQIPVMMVNGRISDKSVKRYHHLRGLLKDMIGSVNKFCMQSPIDASYIVKLGANPALVTVTGNTKFDQTYTDVSPEEKLAILSSMGLESADGILLAGSTHKGEEALLLEAFCRLREEFPDVKLVIAPRDTMRAAEIAHMVQSFGLSAKTRTELNSKLEIGHDAVILDTIGELGKVYSIGDVVYVGGSMVSHGGHNILEPAAHGKAIIVGENMFNFKDTHALFTKRNACITVKSSAELGASILRLFREPGKRQAMEAETLAIVRENRGAARKSAILLRTLMDELAAKEKVRIHSNAKIENIQTYLYRLVHGEVSGTMAGVVIRVLYMFSFIYSQLLELKLLFYRIGILKKHRLACHVISLGNITVGGTGKTPTAQRLAASIRDMGYRVVILNRGYRAKWKGEIGIVSDGETIHMTATEAGDEAFLLAKNLPQIPVLIGADRAVTGKYAVECLGAQVVILDDGYQHWHLVRDMDIVLIDSINVFGNSYMLPRGTLREPIEHLDRADVCLLTKVDQAEPNSVQMIKDTIATHNKKAIIVESTHSPKRFVEISDWYQSIHGDESIGIEDMRERKVIAVSAIGNPASFEQTICDIGAVLVESIRFPDHHDYTAEEMQEVVLKAEQLGAEAIIITAKDAVKIPKSIIGADLPIPVYVLSIDIDFTDGVDEFMDLIRKNLSKEVSAI